MFSANFTAPFFKIIGFLRNICQFLRTLTMWQVVNFPKRKHEIVMTQLITVKLFEHTILHTFYTRQ